MKDILFGWLCSFFFAQIEQIKRRVAWETERDYISKANETRRSVETNRLQNLIGKRVVHFSNEDEPPFIGLAVRLQVFSQAGDNVLVVVDEKTKEEQIVLGKVFEATPEIMEFVERLEPRHWLAVFYRQIY